MGRDEDPDKWVSVCVWVCLCTHFVCERECVYVE